MNTRAGLSEVDIRALVKGDVDDRALAAHKICRHVDRTALTEDERAQAHEILRVMAQDAAELVRRALAVTLRASPNLPRDVALSLARDVESVCTPVLNLSPVFSDEDLAEVVRLGGPVRQMAVAGRPMLSERVTGAIAEHAGEGAVRLAVSNDNALFAERALDRVTERFAASAETLEALAYRRVLPLAVSEKLVALVGEQARAHLVSHHALTPETALRLATGATERATVDLVDQAACTPDLAAFCLHLQAAGRLTPSLLLRALACGEIGFLEHGMAVLAGVPHHRTWLMIHDAGPLGLKALYERAGLPTRLFASFRAGLDTWRELRGEGESDRERFQSRMLERFLTQPQSASREDMDYLLERLDHLNARKRQARIAA